MAGINEIVIKLCAYYNFNIKMATSNQIHPRVEMVKQFFEKLPVDKYEIYYKKIISYCQFFPNHPQLSECLNAILTIENYKSAEMPTIGKVAENFASKTKTPREEVIKNCMVAFKRGAEMSDGQYDTWIRDVRRKNKERERGAY